MRNVKINIELMQRQSQTIRETMEIDDYIELISSIQPLTVGRNKLL
jgi:hypothetical protein